MSQKGIGRLVQVGYAKETTRGTAKTTADYYLAFSEAAIEEKFANAVDAEVYGVIEDNVGQTRVKDWAEGPIKAPIGGKSFGLALLSLMGTDTPAAHSGETIVFDHVMTVQQGAQHQSLTLFIHDPLSAQDYSHANGVVSKIELDYMLGKFVEFSADVKANKGVTVSTLTATQIQEDRFVPQNLTFKVAANVAGLGAASATPIKSAKITISSNIDEDLVMGQTAPRDFLNKEFSVEGQLEAIWQNESDFKTAALANTVKAMRLDLINSTVTLGIGTNPELKIDLAKVYFTEFSRPIKVKDLIYQTVKFKAAYSISDAFMVKATLTNLITAY